MRSDPPQARGYIIPATLIIALIATTVAATMLSRLEGSIEATAEVVRRRQAFYAADGLGRIVIAELAQYLVENRDPTDEELADPENIPPPTIPGYTLEAFELANAASTWDGPISNGAFQGMYAQQKPIDIHIEARDLDNGALGEVDLRVTLAHISLFQFFVFADDYIEIYPGADMTINPGRVHANGDLCMGSTSVLKVGNVTSASKVLAGGDDCRRANGNGFQVWDGSAYKLMTSSTDHGCTSCGGTAMAWTDYAIANWGGNVQDSSHDVNDLRLPLDGTTSTQAGWDAQDNEMINEESLRVLVDPPLADDSEGILSQKLAMKADLRIVNGVWYVNDGTWPGVPIWSDHPGSYTTRDLEGLEGEAQAVGQADLMAALGWAQVPRRYSYYEYDSATSRVSSETTGVISYGSLYRKSSTEWVPGFWAAGGNDLTYTDTDGTDRDYFCAKCNSAKCNDSNALRDATATYCQYQAGGVWYDLKGAQYLQAARGGFTDQRVRLDDSARGGILPINFDVAALAAALHDTSAGELGSYFVDEPFNGIVYITASWSGSMDGFPDGHPQLWPAQGSVEDAVQTRTRTSSTVQTALPYPLCSDSLGATSTLSGTPFSGPPTNGASADGYEPYFAVPSCDETRTGHPNAVRMINGATLDATAFPDGLTVVTNLPMYVLGNYNTGSDTSSSTSTPWLPAMLGADAVSLMSSNWSDANAGWGSTAAASTRAAAQTQWNFSYVGGIVQTVDASHYSGGIENYPRFMESWSGTWSIIRGSLVVGFSSVYQAAPWQGSSTVYNAPKRDWGFDPHLTLLSNQPPGAPLMNVYSVSRMHRR